MISKVNRLEMLPDIIAEWGSHAPEHVQQQWDLQGDVRRAEQVVADIINEIEALRKEVSNEQV